MTESPDWEKCNVAAAAKELETILPLMKGFGEKENPNTDLYLPKLLTDAIRLVTATPTVANAKAVCALMPSFGEVCFRQTPQGAAFEMGEILGSALLRQSLTETELFFGLHRSQISRTKDSFIHDHLLVVAYLTENLIGNADPIEKEFLVNGIRSRMAAGAKSNSVFNEVEGEKFMRTCLQFTHYANSISGKLDENTLHAIVVTMSGGKPDLSNSYRGLLKVSLESVRQLIHQIITPQAGSLK